MFGVRDESHRDAGLTQALTKTARGLKTKVRRANRMLSFQQQEKQTPNVVPAIQSTNDLQQNSQPELQSDIDQQHMLKTSQTMHLREDQPVLTPTTSRSSRKRKSSPSNNNDPPQIQSQAPQIQVPRHLLQTPHTMMHSMQGPLPAYPYAPADYSPAGLPPDHSQVSDDIQQPGSQSPQNNNSRALGSSKRAEQNRKAQRAFRERRDQ